jgi:hypothetical protein
MATSGSTDFDLTRDDIITEALELLGVLPEGATPTADQLTSSARTLNQMIKAWQSKGTQLFVNQRLYIFQQAGKRKYFFSRTALTGDECTTAFTATLLNGALAAAATAVELDDGTATVNGDIIGILLADGSMHWDTIASGGGTTSIVLTTGVPTAANDNAQVYYYTTQQGRFLAINVMTSKSGPTIQGANDVIDGNEIPVEILARQDWSDLSVKRTGGRTTQAYLELLPRVSFLHVWPQASLSTDYLVAWVRRPIEDLDAGADDFDFPQEWLLALSSNLAKWLAPKFGVSDKTWGRVAALAGEALFDAEAGDSEGQFRFTPDDRWGSDGMY